MNRNLAYGLFTAFLTSTSVAHGSGYKLTVTDLGGQPLSPLFIATSNSSYNLFTVGTAASLGIKHIAEMGATGDLVSEAVAAGSNVADISVLGGSPLGTGGSRSEMIWTDAAHPYLNFAAMLGKTNDGFIGDSVTSGGINLLTGIPKGGLTIDIYGSNAWDAGTEANTQNAADLAFLGGTGNPADPDPVVHTHPGIIPNVGDSWQQMPSWGQSQLIATVNVTSTPGPASVMPFAIGSFLAWRKRRRA